MYAYRYVTDAVAPAWCPAAERLSFIDWSAFAQYSRSLTPLQSPPVRHASPLRPGSLSASLSLSLLLSVQLLESFLQ